MLFYFDWTDNMRKNALIICSYTCAIGAFGAFFRWLQNQICYDPITHTMSAGAFSVIIPIMIIAAAAVFYMLIKKLFDKGLVPPTKLYDMFHGTTFVYPIAFCVLAVVMALGGIVTIMNTRFDPQAGLYTVIGTLAIFSGIGFPLICTCAKNRYAPGFVSVLMTLPVLLCSFWLVASYRQNATIPSVSVYSIEILALCACIAAFFFTSGYAYGRFKPVESILSTMFAAFLCFMTLSDTRYIGLQFVVCGCAGMLIVENWMLISNSVMKEISDEPELAEISPAEEAEDNVLKPTIDDIIEEAAAEDTTVVDEGEDDDVKIWKGNK